MKLTVRNICCIAMLVALNIILTRVFSIRLSFEGIEGIRIGFGTLPVLLAGLLLGGKQGFITGVIGDLIGFQLNPSGFYLPTFTLVAGLNGVLAPLMIQWFGNGILSFKKLVIVIGINNIITSLVLTPFLLQLHFGIPLLLTMPGRVLAQAVLIPCMAMTINILIKRLQQSGVAQQYTVKQG
jgi:ECF transporter S component (folate family)